MSWNHARSHTVHRLGRTAPARWRQVAAAGALLVLSVSCGGGDGGGGGVQPPTIASVVITGPLTGPTFQTLTRTAQFTAVARDASTATIPGVTISWASSNTAVATVSASGLVTAVGNGTANISASAGGINSSGLTVTVAQVVANLTATPGTVAFGAIGSTRQLSASQVDSSGAAVAGAPAITWVGEGTGTVATVSPTGLVTAVAVGASDTAVAAAGTRTARIPIAVTQVVASVLVTSTGVDSLKTTGRTKQYTAVARDSQLNTIAGLSMTWSSSAPAVATVGASTGLATAVADGSTNITATTAGVPGQRALHVRRFAETFQMNPNAATITTALGTQIFLGTAQDSVATDLPITWTSRSTSVLTVSPGSGAQTTATAAGNGTSYVVMQAGTRADSALVTVSGQATAPLTATVLVGNLFFRSQRNNTENQAVDTVAVGGAVTFTLVSGSHTVQSQGSPSFASSGTLTATPFVVTFLSAGTYQYDCAIHGASMTGRVVVR